MAIITDIREQGLEEKCSDPKLQYELTYLIKVASREVRLPEVRASREIVKGLFVPRGGDLAYFDPSVVCTDRRFEWTTAPLWCKGVFKFEREPTKDPEREEEENPLARPVKKSWRTNTVNKPVTTDIHGKKILGKAGLPYIEPVEKRTSTLVLDVNRVEASFNGTRAFSLIDKTNEDEVSGAAPGTLLLSISADNFYAIGREFWDVHYLLEYDAGGWNPVVLEQGYMQRDETEGHAHIQDPKTKLPVSEPVPLDADGHAIFGLSLPDAAITTTWEVYQKINYRNELKLPI